LSKFDRLKSAVTDSIKEMKKHAEEYFKIENLVPHVIGTFSKAFSNAMTGVESFGDAMKKALYTLLAEMAMNAGLWLIAWGQAWWVISPAKAIAAIAGGIALLALSAKLSSMAGSVGQSASSDATAASAGSDQSRSTNQDNITRLPFNTSGEREIRLVVEGRGRAGKAIAGLLDGSSYSDNINRNGRRKILRKVG
jgi:hypothetical protein